MAKKQKKKTGKRVVGVKDKPKRTKKRPFIFFKKIKALINRLKLPIRLFLLLAAVVSFAMVLRSLPSPKRLSSFTYPASNQIYDRNGNLLYQIYNEQNRTPVKLEDLPDYIINATLAIEDKNFYTHFGFDLKGISRALINIVFNQRLQGGSTITQQLVKNALLTQSRTLSRKAKEAILTVLTEIFYSKSQILEMYFNQIPYGGTAYGIEAAARTYFGKKAIELDLAEAALLAGLPAAPSSYSPFIHPDRAKTKQEIVLEKMLELEMIDKETYRQAKEEKIVYASPAIKIEAPHFVFYVKEQLAEKYGQQVAERGGLKVTTTLDLEVQNLAQATVATEVAKLKKANVSNGAVLVTNPKTGEILAMVGSKDYFSEDIDGKFNVTTALRQPGSAIKPLNYAVGLALKKVTPATIFADIPSCFSGGPELYCPKNYDGLFHGAVQVRYALGNSFNIPAVKMLALNGIETFIASASAMGLDSLGERDPSEFGLSLTLGGGEVKMTEMATAFGSLANLGVRKNLVSILKVEDRNGQVLEENQFENGERVLPMEAAYLVSQILLDNNARSAAFGSSSDLVVKDHPEVSVKTGTTNDKRDNWTVGYTPNLAVVVWVGNNDNSPMGYIASGVTGASPIWNKVMTKLLEGQKQEWPKKPVGIIGTSVCNLSGAAQPEEGCQLRYEFFIDGTVPPAQSSRKTVLVNRETGWVIQPGEPDDNAEWQEHEIITDPLGVMICLDCAPRDKPVTLRY